MKQLDERTTVTGPHPAREAGGLDCWQIACPETAREIVREEVLEGAF